MAGRDLTRFSGYTARVSEFFEVLESVNEGRYVRSMVRKEGEGTQQQVVTKDDTKGKVLISDGCIKFEKIPV